MSDNIKINRVWQMPNKNTFDIKPIKELIYKYMGKLPENAIIVDPFANKNKIANITNDLDPQYNTTFHMDATDFLKSLDDNSVDMLLYDPPYCYDSETELLTKSGWKNIKDITVENSIATRSANGDLIFEHPTDIIQKEYSGKMIRINNGFTDLLITPNHNCLVKSKGNTYKLVEAGALKDIDNITFTNAFKWNVESKLETVIPAFENKRSKVFYSEKQVYTPDLMSLIGLFIKYGSTKLTAIKKVKGEKYTFKCNVVLDLPFTSKKHINTIEQLLLRIDANFNKELNCYRQNNKIIIENRQLYEYFSLFKINGNSVIPSCVKECSSQDLKRILSYVFTKKDNTFPTSSKMLANDVLEICLKAGLPAVVEVNDSNYTVRLLKKENSIFKISHNDIVETDYSGEVFCVSVPNMVVLAKRNGKVCWCGNSPRQVSECYKNLGKTVNMETTQASYWSKQKSEIGRLVKKGGFVITCSWNSGGIGKKYGFEIVEILLVPHGGWHNDTIIVVEQKVV